MAFYKLYLWFSPWRKKPYPDMIHWFSEYVCKTPEQREREAKQKEYEVKTVLAQLVCIHNMMIDTIGGFSHDHLNHRFDE